MHGHAIAYTKEVAQGRRERKKAQGHKASREERGGHE
jgi:hypothetical protein